MSLTPKNDGVFIEDYNDLDADDDSDYDLYADDDFAKYNEDFDDAMIEADSRELEAEEATFKNDSTVELHYPTTTINTEEEEDCHLKEFKDSSLPPKCRVVYRKINGSESVVCSIRYATAEGLAIRGVVSRTTHPHLFDDKKSRKHRAARSPLVKEELKAKKAKPEVIEIE